MAKLTSTGPTPDPNPSSTSVPRESTADAHKRMLMEVVEEANSIEISTVSTTVETDLTPKDQCYEFLKYLATMHGIPITHAFIAFAALALKGACNQGARNDMSTDVVHEGATVVITKYDLEYACNHEFKHTYLRRIAQALAVEICKYAEKNWMAGDLAKKLNNVSIAKGEGPLNAKERAWACSFCQEVPNLEELAGKRLTTLLAEDFLLRVKTKSQAKADKKAKAKGQSLEPRKWRTGKPQRKTPSSDSKKEGG